MRQALRRKGNAPRQQTSALRSFPAPIGGWNGRDSLASMKSTDAVRLLNWFPRAAFVEVRGGYTSHATGMTGNGKALMAYNALSGVNKLFCATASGIYDVSSSGAVGAAALARTNGKHQHTMFGDGTNNWLIACNGVDKPAYFDGSTWTAVDGITSPALTGVTTTTLVQALVFKGRLIFAQAASLSIWYLTAGAAGGALTEFDLSGEFHRGGYIMALGTWTRDAGDGQDDVFIAVSSEGEVVSYAGTDPSDATKWAKVGTFYVGRPLGRKCLTKAGGDLLILTEGGIYPLSAALQNNEINRKYALSFKIDDPFVTAARTYGANFGWSATLYPAREALIINVPEAEDGVHKQFVMNSVTKAWCEFDSWNAEDFTVFNGELYFTSGTAVYKAWDGPADGTSDVIAYGRPAFTYFEQPSQQKRVTLFRPVLAVNGGISFLAGIDVDFEERDITGLATYSVNAEALWDTAIWDDAVWASDSQIIRRWQSPTVGIGYAVSGKLKIANQRLTIQWIANDYVYETGGVL